MNNIHIESDRRRVREATPEGHESTHDWGTRDRQRFSELEELAAATPSKPVDQMLQEAEQFKVTISAPKGNDLQQGVRANLTVEGSMSVDNDDDFFHVTCHIEPGLRDKIIKGEFVDLEKLLPRSGFRTGEERRLELVSHDGMTYFTPVQDRQSKINSIRKWEQAFRAFKGPSPPGF